MAKETYYFSHDANARNDEKILMLRAEHGMEGYGIYWALLEMMFESSDTKLSHSKVKGIAVSYNTAITLLEDVINTAISEQLFVSDGEKFWSESLIRRKGKFQDLKKKKSEAGKKGMEKRWGKQQKDNTDITPDNTVITKDNKVKESKGKESKTNNYSAEFDKFWSVYPKKVDKQEAYKKFKTKLKSYSLEEILTGTQGYVDYLKKEGTDKQFIKHAKTFLNNNSFLDYSISSVEESKNDSSRDLLYKRKTEIEGLLNLPDDYYEMMGTTIDREALQGELAEIEQQF